MAKTKRASSGSRTSLRRSTSRDRGIASRDDKSVIDIESGKSAIGGADAIRDTRRRISQEQIEELLERKPPVDAYSD